MPFVSKKLGQNQSNELFIPSKVYLITLTPVHISDERQNVPASNSFLGEIKFPKYLAILVVLRIPNSDYESIAGKDCCTVPILFLVAFLQQ